MFNHKKNLSFRQNHIDFAVGWPHIQFRQLLFDSVFGYKEYKTVLLKRLTFCIFAIMLQFIAKINDKYSVAEAAQMAIEGGCKWVELFLPGCSDDFVRTTALELKTLCMETSTFLTIVNRPEVARELGLHGVHLRGAMAAEAKRIREELGAEAIIGVEMDSSAQILSTRSLDIDYVTLPAGTSVDRLASVVADVRGGGYDVPIVIPGEFGPDAAIEAVVAGASGIAVSDAIINAPDPVEATCSLIEALEAARS